MSRSKAELVEIGKKFGIKNGDSIPYGQLEKDIRALKDQADPSKTQTRQRTPRPKGKVSISGSTQRKREQSMRDTAISRRGQAVTRIGRVQLRKGKLRYYYVIKAGNGEITSTSQKYFSKTNAERAAIAVARLNGLAYGG